MFGEKSDCNFQVAPADRRAWASNEVQIVLISLIRSRGGTSSPCQRSVISSNSEAGVGWSRPRTQKAPTWPLSSCRAFRTTLRARAWKYCGMPRSARKASTTAAGSRSVAERRTRPKCSPPIYVPSGGIRRQPQIAISSRRRFAPGSGLTPISCFPCGKPFGFPASISSLPTMSGSVKRSSARALVSGSRARALGDASLGFLCHRGRRLLPSRIAARCPVKFCQRSIATST